MKKLYIVYGIIAGIFLLAGLWFIVQGFMTDNTIVLETMEQAAPIRWFVRAIIMFGLSAVFCALSTYHWWGAWLSRHVLGRKKRMHKESHQMEEAILDAHDILVSDHEEEPIGELGSKEKYQMMDSEAPKIDIESYPPV